MATQKPIEAVQFAKTMVKNMPLQTIWTDIVNDVLSRIWMEAPWSWTLGSFPIVNLSAVNSDYAIAIPSDFLYLRTATIYGSNIERPLAVVASIPDNMVSPGQPTVCCVLGNAGEDGILRVAPQPILSTEYIKGLYKKTLTQYTSETIHTDVMPIPDEWYHVYQAGVLWLAYKYADDTRAGEASFKNDGSFQFNGQRGQFEADLAKMINREPLPLENTKRLVPDEVDTA